MTAEERKQHKFHKNTYQLTENTRNYIYEYARVELESIEEKLAWMQMAMEDVKDNFIASKIDNTISDLRSLSSDIYKQMC